MPDGTLQDILESGRLDHFAVADGRLRFLQVPVEEQFETLRITPAVFDDFDAFLEKERRIQEMLRCDVFMMPDIGFRIGSHDDLIQCFADFHKIHLFLFYGAAKGEISHLRHRLHALHLCHRNVIGVDSTDTPSLPMDIQHDFSCLHRRFMKHFHQNIDDEIHGRVVVVVQNNPVTFRFPQIGLIFRLPEKAGNTLLILAKWHNLFSSPYPEDGFIPFVYVTI